MWPLGGATFGDSQMLGELRFQRLAPHLPLLLGSIPRYALDETTEIADDMVSRYSQCISESNTFPHSRAAFSPERDQ